MDNPSILVTLSLQINVYDAPPVESPESLHELSIVAENILVCLSREVLEDEALGEDHCSADRDRPSMLGRFRAARRGTVALDLTTTAGCRSSASLRRWRAAEAPGNEVLCAIGEHLWLAAASWSW